MADGTGPDGPDALVFVHLSDLHFREGGTPLAEREAALRERLLDDIPEVVRLAAGQLEAILLTGDLARSGQAAEYAEGRRWLDRLCERLGLPETATLTCPGNHDVDWTAIDTGREAINEVLRTCPDNVIDRKIDLLLENDPAGVLKPLENYQEFAAGCACDVERCLAWEISPLPMQGGYSLVIRGASSVINSDKHDADGTMAVHTNQLIAKAQPGVIRMLLLHHGTLFWRRPLPGPAEHDHNVVLYGHTHSPHHNMPTPRCLEITAGAIHPEEHEFSIPSYNVLVISVEEDDAPSAHARIQVFHREFSRKANAFVEIPGGMPSIDERIAILRAAGGVVASPPGLGGATGETPGLEEEARRSGEPEIQPPLETATGQPEPSRLVRSKFERLGSGDRLRLLDRMGLSRDEFADLPPHRLIREVAQRVVADGSIEQFMAAEREITGDSLD
jgi:predicted MPP superfamily phosphohydrolase